MILESIIGLTLAMVVGDWIYRREESGTYRGPTEEDRQVESEAVQGGPKIGP